ncbi:MAG: hypothetical protein OEX22_10810 [Cyclobacteriaceae bacterium]|nr:hypothetical protein [Cyclobacteriaceae bacterium]
MEKVLQKEQSLSGTFIQYNTNITKFNVQQVPVLQHTHDNYLKKLKKTGSVLFEGYFDNDDGGIMIMEGKVADQVITLDPTIQSGFMNDIITEVKIYKH